jgi:E3 ubiquitin-protein ligase MYCBP2
MPGVGAKFGRRATWVDASGDQTFLKIDESLINAHTLPQVGALIRRTLI